MTHVLPLFTFHFGCGCSRTYIYLSAKWSCPTISFQAFKFFISSQGQGHMMQRALGKGAAWAGRGDTSSRGGDRGRFAVGVVPKPWAEQMNCPWSPTGIASFASSMLLRNLGCPSLSEGPALSRCSDRGWSQCCIPLERGRSFPISHKATGQGRPWMA